MSYFIGRDNYFKRLQPAKTEELVNLIQVPIIPLEIQDYDDELYKGDPILFSAGEIKTIEIEYSDIPSKDMVAHAYLSDVEGTIERDDISGEVTNSELTIYPSTYYAWGASLTIDNDESSDQYVVIIVSGYALKGKANEFVSAQDNENIVENGVLKKKIKKNHLIQSRVLGHDIADTLLNSFSLVRKDVVLIGRGNLCLRLMHEIETIEYDRDGIYSTGDFYLYKMQSIYDGTFKQNLNGRKIE